MLNIGFMERYLENKTKETIKKNSISQDFISIKNYTKDPNRENN